MTRQKQVSTTAVGLIDFETLPAGTETTVIPLAAADGAGSRGVLYARGGERTVVVVSHPRGDMTRHYAAPAVLEAGYAFYAHTRRSLNNDVDIEHERLLLDLAAGLSHLKNERGYENIVLLGNSGGGSLLTFYQQQASTAPPGRLTDTASGDPLDLNAVEMPKADGLVLLAAHPGQGAIMLTGIDPSVVDEDEPLAVDPELDMYNPANGFREPPEPSKYSVEFLERYRAAQQVRVAGLDARARALIAEQRRHRQKMQEPGFADLPLEERTYITRRAVAGHYMVVHRTEADPAYLDVSLHSWKSTRTPASILGPRPDQVNYAPGGFGRLVTPRAWLSTWSGLSTRATLIESLKSIHEPLLLISLTSDSLGFPDASRAHLDASPPRTRRSGSWRPSISPLPSRNGKRPCASSSSGSLRTFRPDQENDMKRFVVTLELLAGPPGPEVSEAQQGFLAELFEQGTLVMSGPFSDGRGGMAILRGDSLEAAQDLYGESPIVRSGGAAVDVREWNVLLDSTRR